MCEANSATAQPKDDDLTEHYELNLCLRSLLGGHLLMHIDTQDKYDVLKTRCEEGGGHIRTSHRSRNMKIGFAIVDRIHRVLAPMFADSTCAKPILRLHNRKITI